MPQRYAKEKKTVSNAFSLRDARLSHAWKWLWSPFENDYEKLMASPELTADTPERNIWDTKQKYVLKLHTPEGRVIAYKTYRTMQASRYYFRLSPLANEAENYQRFLDMGLPMAKLLAVGETRHCFRITTGFLMTEFIEDAQDGGCFRKGKPLEHETALRDELVRRNMVNLALLHDNGYLHRGLTPYNFLWRKRETPDQDGHLCDLVWIDVASCHRMPRWLLKLMLVKDFVKFFHFFEFSREELRGYLTAYSDAAQRPFLTLDALCENVVKGLEDHRKRHSH